MRIIQWFEIKLSFPMTYLFLLINHNYWKVFTAIRVINKNLLIITFDVQTGFSFLFMKGNLNI